MQEARLGMESSGGIGIARSLWDLPPGVYRVRVDLKPPLRLWKYTPGFQVHADPDRIELLHCPARVELIVSRRR